MRIGWVGVLATFALAVALASCRTSAPPEQKPAAPESRLPSPGPTPKATDPGFSYCCGADDYKLEMSCSQRIKRCYERTSDGWRHTYGRHCKKLGSACYLRACEETCS